MPPTWTYEGRQLSSDFRSLKHLSIAIHVCLGHEHRYHVRLNTEGVVGRRGLEPCTSALIDLERSATEGRTLHETAGVIGLGFQLVSLARARQ